MKFIVNSKRRVLIRKSLFFMRLTAILLFASCLTASAGAKTQGVSISVQNERLEKVFKEIKKQTDFVFFYDSRILEKAKRVTLNVRNKPVDEVLKEALQDQPLDFAIAKRTITIFEKTDIPVNVSQVNVNNPPKEVVPEITYVTISGVVKDAQGNPLAGVSIVVKGTKRGTSTATDGNFSIEANVGDVLVFTMVGFRSVEILLKNTNALAIKMEVKETLATEVVIVGYGTQKKESVSGAVSVVSMKEIANRPVNNTIQALQGLSPGLVVTRTSGMPGAEGWNMNIRGFSSLNGTNNPLIVVDGVEYGDLTLINPDDIESISILKDASAAAIYGAKASNGVLLITTKAGKDEPTRVRFTSMYQLKKTIDLPKQVSLAESLRLQDTAQKNAGRPMGFPPEMIDKILDPSITFIPDDPDGWYFYDNNNNYVNTLVKKLITVWQNNVDISGGNNSTKYFIGLGYNKNNGMFKVGPDGEQRYNARMNLNIKFNKNFSLDSRLSFINNKMEQAVVNRVVGDYGLLYNIYTFRQTYPIFVPGDNTKFMDINSTNSYATLKEGGSNELIKNIFDGVFTLKADHLLKGLVLSSNLSPHFEQQNNDIFAKQVPLYSWNASQQTFVPNAAISRTGSMQRSRASVISYSFNTLADYDLNVSDNHFHVLGGYQFQQYNFNYIYASQGNITSRNLASLNYTTDNSIPLGSISDNIQKNAWQSIFGRFNYDFKNKYFFEATVRNDASSRLAPGYQSQTFPAFSVAWRLSQEGWMRNLSAINELKLRGSWGKLGNAQLGGLNSNNYMSVPLLNTGVYPFNNQATLFLFQNALPSAALGWEKVATTDIGLDFGLINGKLNGSFDYYWRKNDKMLTVINLPVVLGVSPSTTNGAAMKTEGWELEIKWKDGIRNFRYGVGLNLSDNQNKITQYLGNVVYSEGLNVAIPGLPINSIFGYKSLGYFQSDDEVAHSPKQFGTAQQGPGDIKYEDINGDGFINGGVGTKEDHGDLIYLGNTSPRYSFGINLNAQWKNFDITVFLQGVAKRNFIIYPNQAIAFVEGWRSPLAFYVDNFWTPTNRNARFPRLIIGGSTNAHINSAFVQNGAYARLKNLQIGYSFSSRLLERIKAQQIRIFFSGQDIWTVRKAWYKYFDPESPNNVAYAYPFFAVYSFGLNITL